jgi:hypothetical protein
VDNLRDPDPTKRFSAYTTPANAVRIEVASPCFTYKGITLSTEGDQPWFHFNRSKYPDLTCRIRFCSKRIGDSIEDFYVGPSIPPMNWGNSLRAIWLIPFMLLRDVLDSLHFRDDKALSELYANRSHIVGVAQTLLPSLLLIVSSFLLRIAFNQARDSPPPQSETDCPVLSAECAPQHRHTPTNTKSCDCNS